MNRTRAAFTLVELSIVLVILGLLIGGVLTGQSLIRAAELRSVSTQYQRFHTATHTFRDKYFALPGDMTNAQSYWGIAHATAATCVTTASTDSKTCNGNGDGSIAMTSGSNEFFRFWQHLANAGLIEGSYSGIAQGTLDTSTTSANSPTGRISSTLWKTNNVGTQSGHTNMFDGTYGNSFFIGGMLANNWPITAAFKPEDAYNIDMKMDDGKPGTGKVAVYTSGGMANCSDTASPANLNANYNLAYQSAACTLYFRHAY